MSAKQANTHLFVSRHFGLHGPEIANCAVWSRDEGGMDRDKTFYHKHKGLSCDTGAGCLKLLKSADYRNLELGSTVWTYAKNEDLKGFWACTVIAL